MNFALQRFWSLSKMRIKYWYWIIKYRGKKNIPPDVIFGEMNKTMQSLVDNFKAALNVGVGDMSHQETMEGLEIMKKIKELEKGIKEIQVNRD